MKSTNKHDKQKKRTANKGPKQSASVIKQDFLLGVLTHPIKTAPGTNPKVCLNNYRELAEEGLKQNIRVVVFTPEQVNLRNKTIEGIALLSAKRRPGRWKKAVLPLPQVVYNRIPNRKIEGRPLTGQMKTFLDKKNIPLFNPFFLNKWELYLWLQNDPILSVHIPETRKYSGAGLKELLAVHGSVYVKPVNGSLGRGIIRIDADQNRYTLLYRAGSRFIQKSLRSLGAVRHFIKRTIGKTPYMIQQTIALQLFQDRFFDIRTLVQKDGEGQWKLTGMAVRVSDAAGHVTHTINGGTAFPLPEVLDACFHSDPAAIQHMQERLHRFAETVPSIIETCSGGQFGEFSFDIGLDQESKIWLIEANAKPFRFDEDSIRLLSRRRILEYARYLASRK